MPKSDWNKTKFNYSRRYLTYEARFVARFKHFAQKMGDFKKFLIENFAPEEYFARLKNNEAPLEILESKGYVLPHIREELMSNGYPVTPEGFREYIRDQAMVRQV